MSTESLGTPIKMYWRQYNTKDKKKMSQLLVALQYIRYISLILHALK